MSIKLYWEGISCQLEEVLSFPSHYSLGTLVQFYDNCVYSLKPVAQHLMSVGTTEDGVVYHCHTTRGTRRGGPSVRSPQEDRV